MTSLSLSRVSLVLVPRLLSGTATTESYSLSLHDALPIYQAAPSLSRIQCLESRGHFIGRILPQRTTGAPEPGKFAGRSEEHTSELQSHSDLVCRLLLEKKKK